MVYYIIGVCFVSIGHTNKTNRVGGEVARATTTTTNRASDMDIEDS